MMEIEDFGKNLFRILSQKLIQEENLDVPEGNLECSDANDVSKAVLMLSYVYKPAFTDRYNEVMQDLKRKNENSMIYVRTFAEILLEKYSSVNFLTLCSFISELFLSLSSCAASEKKHFYEKHTEEALTYAFRRIFKQDFPKNGWTDIQDKASLIAKGYEFLKPLMNEGTSNVCDVAREILTGASELGNKQWQTDIFVAENPSQQMTTLYATRIFTNITVLEVPIFSEDGSLTNQTAYFAPNLVYTPVAPIAFGTIDENPELLKLLDIPGDQNEGATCENRPSEMESNVPKVDETTDLSNIESKHLTARNPEDEQKPVFRTVKKTDNGEIEICNANNEVISEQELIKGEEQFWRNPIRFSTDDSLHDKIKKHYSSCLEWEKLSNEENVNDPKSETFSKEEYGNDPKSETFSKEEYGNDPKSETFSKEEYGIDPERETFLKENVKDPENETFSEENTLSIGNTVNVPESQSETFCKRQSNAALQDFTANKADSSQKNDAQQSNEIEINFLTDEKNLSAKVLHLDLGGEKFIVRMPADILLVFKYNGQTSSSKKPEA